MDVYRSFEVCQQLEPRVAQFVLFPQPSRPAASLLPPTPPRPRYFTTLRCSFIINGNSSLLHLQVIERVIRARLPGPLRRHPYHRHRRLQLLHSNELSSQPSISSHTISTLATQRTTKWQPSKKTTTNRNGKRPNSPSSAKPASATTPTSA